MILKTKVLLSIAQFVLVYFSSCSSTFEKYPAKVWVREGRSKEDGHLVKIEALGETRELHVTPMMNIWSDNAQAVFLSHGVNGEEIYERKNIPKNIDVYHDYKVGSVLSVKHGIVHGILDSKHSITCEDGNHFIIKTQKNGTMSDIDDDYKLINDNVRKPREISQKDYNRKAKTFTPEIAVVVSGRLANLIGNDTQIYQYLAIYWNAIKKRFKTIRNPRINIKLVGSFIYRNSSHETYYRPFETNTTLLSLVNTHDIFSYWVYSKLDILPDHDILILQTDFPLYENTLQADPSSGMAIIKGACRKRNTVLRISNAVAYIYDPGAFFRNVNIAAHEIGHSLGAKHDNKTHNVEGCMFSDGYIMSYYVYSRRSLFFSWCSVCEMANHMSSKKGTCLTESVNKTQPTGVYKTKILPGHILTMSQQCQKLENNPDSVVYTGGYSEDELCHNIQCSRTVDGRPDYYTYKFGALEGSQCPSKGRCKNGRCL